MAHEGAPERLRRLNEVLHRTIEQGTITPGPDRSTQEIFPIAIPGQEGEALQHWVEREHAVRTIEVGFAFGISTLFVCAGLLTNGDGTARHVALDPNQLTGFASVGLHLLEKARVRELVEFHGERSEVALPRFLSEGRSFDLAFVDGNHRFDWVFLDAIYLGRLVRPGGVVMLDDYQLPSVRKAASFCVNDLAWSVEDEGTAGEHHGWVVLRTARPALDRRFDHF